jgi:N-acetylneuraminic acid mutarotase
LLAASTLLLAALACRNDGGPPTEPVATAPQTSPEFAVASNTWVQRADMPTDRWDLAAAVVKNAKGQSVLYAIGGCTQEQKSLRTVQAYNVATGKWQARTFLSRPLCATNGAAAIGGKIYMSGGAYQWLGTGPQLDLNLRVYDPATNSWGFKQGMPTEGYAGVSGVIGGKLYVLTYCHEDYCFDEVDYEHFYRYDPSTDEWTDLPRPPNHHQWGMAAAIRGKFYVVGGGSRALDIYDPATNTWTTRTGLAQARGGGAGVSLGGKFYVIGGSTSTSGGPIRWVSVYNPATDTWSSAARMPTPLYGIAAAVVELNGQKLIAVVGGAKPGNHLQYAP